jgi:transcriptional regulator with XRE-family HTH domain
MTPIQRIYAGLGFNEKSRQSEFAELAGVSQATVSRWLSGKDRPRMETISRLRERAKKRGLRWKDAWAFDALKHNGQGDSA